MLPYKFLRVLEHEGVVAIATQGPDGLPHLVNTWNSYVHITEDEHLVIPAGGMHTTERNLAHRNAILLTAGSREVDGKHGPGTGFLVEGTADFLSKGPELEVIKRRFPWARAALKISVTNVVQTL